MIRPEALALLRRWLEPALVALVSVWIALEGWRSVRLGSWGGWITVAAAVLIGGGWLRAAVARARLPSAELPEDETPRVVVHEERIRHYGPFGRVEIAATTLERVEIAPGPTPEDALWLLSAPGRPPVAVPARDDPDNRVIDALAALPGFSYEAALAAMGADDGVIRQIWPGQAPTPRASL